MKSLLIIETPVFTKRITDWLSDEEYRAFQTELTRNPEAGDLIPGMGGLRKVRLALPGRGKRGGARILYLLLMRHEALFLLYAYTKNEFEELPAEKKAVIRHWAEAIKKEYRP